MDYKTPAQARELPGLRIALTAGLPAPWSMAARFMFDVKGIAYTPVIQVAGQPNEELVAWTGHRNAPLVILDDQPARSNWADILQLAEQLQPQPSLIPADDEERLRMFGLCNEICGAGGLTWNARHLMIGRSLTSGIEQLMPVARTLASAYGYSAAAAEAAPARIQQILALLAAQLNSQQAIDSPYFIGGQLSALDLIWASFSNTLRPLPEQDNPMDPGMRKVYQRMGDNSNPPEILFQHRDYIYHHHLTLPLDF